MLRLLREKNDLLGSQNPSPSASARPTHSAADELTPNPIGTSPAMAIDAGSRWVSEERPALAARRADRARSRATRGGGDALRHPASARHRASPPPHPERIGGHHTHRLLPARLPGHGDDDEAVDGRGQHRTAVVVDVITEQLDASRRDGNAVWRPGRPERLPAGPDGPLEDCRRPVPATDPSYPRASSSPTTSRRRSRIGVDSPTDDSPTYRLTDSRHRRIWTTLNASPSSNGCPSASSLARSRIRDSSSSRRRPETRGPAARRSCDRRSR